MLRINNNKKFYTFDKNACIRDNEDFKLDHILVPKFTSPNVLTFDKWKERYASDINKITETFLYMIMTASSDKYICHINVQKLKQAFIRKLYETSYNREKKY